MKSFMVGLVKKLLCVILAGVTLSACHKSNIELVKSGVMNDHKSLTIGEAFDNWSDCVHGKEDWSEFETDNNRKVVQFTCHVKNVNEFFNSVISKRQEQDRKNDEYSLNDNPDFKIEQNENKYLSLEVTNVSLSFQWVINKDDSFELANISEYIKWKDGKSIDFSASEDTMLPVVYDNEITFDLEKVNDDSLDSVKYIYAMATAFGSMYLKAN